MMTRRHLLAGSSATLAARFVMSPADAQGAPARITVLFDAFGKPSALKRGRGYSAFIEHGGRRILFDTGAKGDDFAANASALGVDLKNLDFVVISHRHNDHTGGLNHVLSQNPNVTIYTPVEGGGFNSQFPPALVNLMKRNVASIPDEMRYFGGNPPAELRPEPPWANGRFVQIREQTEVLPGAFLFSTQSDVAGTREMNEISLVLKTPKGSVLVWDVRIQESRRSSRPPPRSTRRSMKCSV